MLIIQFAQSDSFDSDDDLEFRQEVEELADACLRRTNVGHCDGGDIGNGKMNVFCTVTDGQRGCDMVVSALEGAGIEGAIIAFVEDGREEDVDPRVLWPRDFAGTFSVL
jgi:hypothetical protein